jgi:hypothetical protein
MPIGTRGVTRSEQQGIGGQESAPAVHNLAGHGGVNEMVLGQCYGPKRPEGMRARGRPQCHQWHGDGGATACAPQKLAPARADNDVETQRGGGGAADATVRQWRSAGAGGHLARHDSRRWGSETGRGEPLRPEAARPQANRVQAEDTQAPSMRPPTRVARPGASVSSTRSR